MHCDAQVQQHSLSHHTTTDRTNGQVNESDCGWLCNLLSPDSHLTCPIEQATTTRRRCSLLVSWGLATIAIAVNSRGTVGSMCASADFVRDSWDVNKCNWISYAYLPAVVPELMARLVQVVFHDFYIIYRCMISMATKWNETLWTVWPARLNVDKLTDWDDLLGNHY